MARKKTEDRVAPERAYVAPESARAAGVQMMLRQGARWQNDGMFYQALDAYAMIVQDYPDTDEAREAEARMLAVAQSLEAAGKYHQALALYRRISESQRDFQSKPAEDAEAARAARRERVLDALARMPAKPEE